MSIDLREVTAGELMGLVLDRVLDVGIGLTPIEAVGLRCVRAWAEPLSILGPLGHWLGERDRVRLVDVAMETFVMPSPTVSPGYAAQIDAVLERYGVRPAKRVVSKHQNTMISLASTGRGLALLPESIAHGLTTVVVVPLNEPDAEVVSWFVYRDEDPSEAISFALGLASMIDAGEALPSDTARDA